MKKLYRRLIKQLDKLFELLYILKVYIAEQIAILRKGKMYNHVKISQKRSKQINDLWMSAYGKKISIKWHKLYMSINNQFNYDYFPDYIFSTRLEPKLNPIKIAKFYSDKSLTELLYKSVKEVKFPKTIIVNCNGHFHNSMRNLINENDVIKTLLLLEEFIIKPTIGGSSGQNVKLISLIDKDNNEKINLIKLTLNVYKQDFIIQLRLKPHESFKKIYPHSINTIRLITYIIENEVYHAPLSLRMGVGGSNVDNIHAGGIGVGISDDGYLKKYAYQLGYYDSKTKFEKHPDSKVKFEGYYIAQTGRMIDIAKKLHVHTPHLGIVSWDFTLDNSNEIVLVEGNYIGQAVWFTQIVNEASIFGENTSKLINLCK